MVSNETVRTYHAVDNRVKDHLTGTMDTYDNVLYGKGIDKLIETRRKC